MASTIRGKPIGDDKVAKPGMEQPVYYWSPSTAPGGLAFYKGKSQAWADSVFVGMLNGRLLDRIKLVNGKVVDEEALADRLQHAHPRCADGVGRRGLCGDRLRRHRHHRSDAGHGPAAQAGAGELVPDPARSALVLYRLPLQFRAAARAAAWRQARNSIGTGGAAGSAVRAAAPAAGSECSGPAPD